MPVTNTDIYNPRSFIGRETEVSELASWFRESSDKSVFTLLGAGGIGKSILAEHFCKIASTQVDTIVTALPIDLFWTVHQVQSGLLRSIASQLDQGGTFAEFYRELDRPSATGDYSNQVRETFIEGMRKLLDRKVLIAFDTSEQASNSFVEFITDILPQITVDNSNIRVLITGRSIPQILRIRNEMRTEHLSGLEPDDFSEYFSRYSVRVIPSDIAKSIHQLVGGKPMWAGLYIDWVNSGNDPRSTAVASMETLRRQIMDPFARIDQPVNLAILIMSYLVKWCDEQILSKVLETVSEHSTGLLDELSRFTFVKYRPGLDGQSSMCVLHDEMCDLIRKYIWGAVQITTKQRKVWADIACKYYDDRIHPINKFNRLGALDVQTLQSERLYYRFDVDSILAFEEFKTLFDQASSTDIREQLISTVDSATNTFGISLMSDQIAELNYRQALVDHARERYESGLTKLQAIIQDQNCPSSVQHKAKVALITTMSTSGKASDAVALGKSWLNELPPISQGVKPPIITQIDIPTQGSLYAQVGQAYRKLGKSSEAKWHYITALDLFSSTNLVDKVEVSSVKINLAYVYHELGESSKALAQCHAALWINETIGDPYQLGRAHNVLGLIYDGILREDDAKDHFEKALSFFNEAKSKRGKAMTQIALARMLRQKEHYNLSYDRSNPDQVSKTFNRADQLLYEAIENLKEGDTSLLALALNEQGTLFRQTGKYQQALNSYRQSLLLAVKLQNTYRQADNLQDIAIAHLLMNEPSAAIDNAEQSILIAENHNHPHLVGRALRTIANVRFQQGNYDAAFEAIGKSCVDIVRIDTESVSDSRERKTRLFEEWLYWIRGLLLAIDDTSVRNEKIDKLIAKWREDEMDGVKLDALYPGFTEALETLALSQ